MLAVMDPVAASPKEAQLPPTVAVDLHEPALRDYWRRRAEQHAHDSYAGVPLAKFPEDLRVYEHLLWLDAPDTVVELGTLWGGSALWFRDRLAAMHRYGRIAREPIVISVDIAQVGPRRALDGCGNSDGIELVEGDLAIRGSPSTSRSWSATAASSSRTRRTRTRRRARRSSTTPASCRPADS